MIQATEIITFPVSFSAAGDNDIVSPNQLPAQLEEFNQVYVSTMVLIPEGETRFKLKQVNLDTLAEEVITGNMKAYDGQPFNFETASPVMPFIFKLRQNHKLVIEMPTSVAVEGFINVAYRY